MYDSSFSFFYYYARRVSCVFWFCLLIFGVCFRSESRCIRSGRMIRRCWSIYRERLRRRNWRRWVL